jgi:5-methylcytosine-specific restriction endonuclease McrA
MEKKEFRKSETWKTFSEYLRNKRGNKCEFCGSKSKRLGVHHLIPGDYNNVSNENDFKVLCFSCHKLIENIGRRKDKNTIPCYFLDFIAR